MLFRLNNYLCVSGNVLACEIASAFFFPSRDRVVTLRFGRRPRPGCLPRPSMNDGGTERERDLNERVRDGSELELQRPSSFRFLKVKESAGHALLNGEGSALHASSQSGMALHRLVEHSTNSSMEVTGIL